MESSCGVWSPVRPNHRRHKGPTLIKLPLSKRANDTPKKDQKWNVLDNTSSTSLLVETLRTTDDVGKTGLEGCTTNQEAIHIGELAQGLAIGGGR